MMVGPGHPPVEHRFKPDRSGKCGRPSKFTVPTAMAIVADLGEGRTPREAAARAGVGLATLHRWLVMGRAGHPAYEAFDRVATRARRDAWKLECFDEAYRELLLRRSGCWWPKPPTGPRG